MAAKVAVIDSEVAGIAGDMLMSSLVDAGANKGKVIDAIFACQNFLKGSKIAKVDFAKVMSHGLVATQMQMKYTDDLQERKGVEMHRSLARCCDSLGLEQRAKTFVLESVKTIILAEDTIHVEIYDN